VLAQRDVWPERIRPLRRVEYDALVERGLLADARVELLLGHLIEMTPQGPLDADVVAKLAALLGRALPSVVEIRSPSPLAVSDDSEPEPDIAVVPAGDYRTSHPNRAVLVIEVAETSLLEDRGIKTALYATAEIPEFWIVNLTEKIVEVHRRPGQGRYAEIQRIDRRGIVGPAAFPEVQIRVGDLIP
jgi:Uma2 family endonuclease